MQPIVVRLPQRRPCVARAEALRGVLDHRQAVARGDRVDRVACRRTGRTGETGMIALRARRDRRLDQRGVDVTGVGSMSTIHRHARRAARSASAVAMKVKRGRDDLVARAYARAPSARSATPRCRWRTVMQCVAPAYSASLPSSSATSGPRMYWPCVEHARRCRPSMSSRKRVLLRCQVDEWHHALASTRTTVSPVSR